MYFKLAPNGYFHNSFYTLLPFIERYTERRWDKRLRRKVLVKRYMFYDNKTETIYFPRCDLDALCTYLSACQVKWELIEVPINEGLSVDIPFKYHQFPDKNEIQRLGIESITKSTDSLRALALQTGTGKTYSAIKAAALLGKRTIFCIGGMINQWYNEIKKFTYLEDKDIYIIQGGDSIKKLLDQCDKTLFPKVIISSIDTLRGYCSNNPLYSNFPNFDTFFTDLNIGVKVTDEAHLNFHTNLIIDIRTNIAITIPLTATFDRNDPVGKEIFDRVYPIEYRFGQDSYSKYVDIYAYEYSSGTFVSPSQFTGSYGYNHAKYENWLLKKGGIHFKYVYRFCVSNLIEAHYISVKKPGEKLMILCFTKALCQKYVDKISDMYPDLKVAKYIDVSPDSVLTDNDIIVTTPGSGGTGRDIKNLKTVICMYNTNSDVLKEQMLGRLRRLDPEDVPVETSNRPIFVTTYNRDIPKHIEYHRGTSLLYKEKGYSYTEYKLP